MILSKNLSKKTFAIYGLGLTGISVIKFLKRSKVKKYCLWDDKQSIRKKFGIKGNKHFFSSLYKPGATNFHIWIKIIGLPKKIDAKNASFK